MAPKRYPVAPDGMAWAGSRSTKRAGRERAPIEMSGGGKTILVVDDQRAVAEALGERSTARGYRVRQAYGGATAPAEVARAAPDLAPVDLVMPVVDGRAGAERLSELGIPVILASGVMEAVPERPGIAFVAKPFDVAALGAEIERTIGTAGPPAAG